MRWGLQPARIAVGAGRRGAQQKVGELAGLCRVVARQAPTAIVEIGSLRGGTLWAWAHLAGPDGVIVGVDLPGGAFGGGHSEHDAERVRSYSARGRRVHLLPADSHAPETLTLVKQALDGRAADFLFIDGDHTYAGVQRDFEMYAPLVRAGGIVAFHDIVPHPAWADCEVDALWRRLKETYRHREFVERDDYGWETPWGGIGVLFWPGLPA